MTDLRVQLHKKRQQQQTTVVQTPKEDLESDVDSLENARVTSSDDDEFVQTTISRNKPLSNNRVVQKSSPRKVGFDQELPTKRLVLHRKFYFIVILIIFF